MKILLHIAYNGTHYSGFQRQPKSKSRKPTIQNVMEDTLNKFYKRPDDARILTTASGRTDAGVHADDQPLSFILSEVEAAYMPPEKIARVLNKLLPINIRVLKSCEIRKEFHPRFSAKLRLYVYSLGLPVLNLNENTSNERIHFMHHALCRTTLLSCLKTFEGTHDFTTFCSANDASTSKVRHIYQVLLKEEPTKWQIYIYGNAFLRGMVRSIIGNSILISKTKNPAKTVQKLLAAKNPLLAKARVPACGLCLKKVFYSQIF